MRICAAYCKRSPSPYLPCPAVQHFDDLLRTCHAVTPGTGMHASANGTTAVRCFARVALILAGIVVWLASGALALLFVMWFVVGKSWVLGIAGMAVSFLGFALGQKCLGRGLQRSTRMKTGPSRPVSMLKVVITVAVCSAILLTLFALTVHDAGGFERLLLERRTHGAILGWFLLLSLAITPIVILIHELGHVLAGAVVGLRFQFVQVGPVALVRERESLRLRWNQPLPDDVLGFQSSIPEGEQVRVANVVAHAAGGVVLNLVTVALAGVVAAAVGPGRTAGGVALLDAVKVAAVLSALGVLNLVPFRTPRGRLTDGALMVYYMRRGEQALSSFLQASKRHARGLRPREWDVDAVELGKWADSDRVMGPRLLLTALEVALDQGDRLLAREFLARTGKAKEPLVQAEFTLQEVLLDALDGHTSRARERLNAAGTHPWNADYSALAEAAVLIGEDKSREAAEALKRWDRLITSSPPTVRVGNEWAEETIRARLGPLTAAAPDQSGT